MEKQSCIVAGILGIGMLCAAFSTMTVSDEQNAMLRKQYYKNDGKRLDEIFEKIVVQRRNLYFQGIIIGLILSYFLLNIYKTVNTFHRISFVTAVTLMTSVLYYFLMPKSDYMLNHLTTKEENKAWLSVYKYMKQRYFLGFLFGSLAAIPIAYSMCLIL